MRQSGTQIKFIWNFWLRNMSCNVHFKDMEKSRFLLNPNIAFWKKANKPNKGNNSTSISALNLPQNQKSSACLACAFPHVCFLCFKKVQPLFVQCTVLAYRLFHRSTICSEILAKYWPFLAPLEPSNYSNYARVESTADYCRCHPPSQTPSFTSR